MAQMWKSVILPAFVILGTLPLSISARAQTCAERLTATSRAPELIDCVKELASRPLVTAIPKGVVLAFDNDSGCPAGWSVFKPATGRMIVGSGDTYEVGMH